MTTTLIQVTDTHLLGETQAQLRGVNPWDNLQAVLRLVKQQAPDGLLLTGDLAEAGEAQAYAALNRAIATCAIPTYWVPGNHDSPTAWPGPPLPQRVRLGAWQLLLLDSVQPDSLYGAGQLSAASLSWLHQQLRLHPQPALLALHHHPVVTGVDWLDQISLQNDTALLQLLATYPQVQLVLFGHIHQTLERRLHLGNRPVMFYGCPSTCTQVSPAGPSRPQQGQPGFRRIWLEADGQHRTQVQRVAKPVLTQGH